MPRISILDFAEFSALSSHSSQRAFVRNLRTRDEYDIRRDYWRQFRDGIKAFFRGDISRNQLQDRFSQAHVSRQRNYLDAFRGFLRFYDRLPHHRPIPPPEEVLLFGDLESRVAPEVYFQTVEGRLAAIKLYLRPPQGATPGSRAIASGLALLQVAFPQHDQGILDVQDSRMLTAGSLTSEPDFLSGQAVAFLEAWHGQ